MDNRTRHLSFSSDLISHNWIVFSDYHQNKAGKQSETNVTSDNLDTKEEGYCTNSEVMTNVTLRGGITTGRFRDRGKVPNMRVCVEICCISKTCDVAFMLKNNCFSVTCFNEKLCEAVRARSSMYSPKLVYIYARTKSDLIATPAKIRRSRRFIWSDVTQDQFSERRAPNRSRRVGRDRFKREIHRKVNPRSTRGKQLAKN